MERPLVSVITVTYNSALYVRDAIESVLAQTYTNLEYIIGDDCSTDDSFEIAGTYTDPRIRAYRNDTNLGEYPNRNKAIRMASGKYLLFIDGDDVIYPHGVAYFVEMMEQYPDAALAIQKNYFNNILFPVQMSSREAIINHFFGRVSFLTSSFASNFFRTEVLKKENGLSDRYRIGDDEIRIRLAATYPILLLAGMVTWPRETPGQASSKLINGVGLIDLFRIVREQYDAGRFGSLGGNTDRQILQKMNRDVISSVKRSLLKGKIKQAIGLMKMANLKWGDLIKKGNRAAPPEDFLAHSTPARPFKRGFISKHTERTS